MCSSRHTIRQVITLDQSKAGTMLADLSITMPFWKALLLHQQACAVFINAQKRTSHVRFVVVWKMRLCKQFYSEKVSGTGRIATSTKVDLILIAIQNALETNPARTIQNLSYQQSSRFIASNLQAAKLMHQSLQPTWSSAVAPRVTWSWHK